ncbi:MAG: NADH-quinone oxidoreductase subunit J [Acidimicrobiales bacterium]
MNLLAAATTQVATTQLGIDSAWAVYAAGTLFILAGAAGVVLLRNPVHCALSLALTIFGIMLMFIDQGADFLAAVQLIVYGGAIVILFLFVVMLLGVDRKEPRTQQRLRLLTPAALLLTVVAFAELMVLSRVHHWATGGRASTEALNGAGENVQKLGQSIFTSYLLPFEMTSALLVIAVVAAVVLVRRSAGPGPGPQRKAVPAARHPTRTPGTPASLASEPPPAGRPEPEPATAGPAVAEHQGHVPAAGQLAPPAAPRGGAAG